MGSSFYHKKAMEALLFGRDIDFELICKKIAISNPSVFCKAYSESRRIDRSNISLDVESVIGNEIKKNDYYVVFSIADNRQVIPSIKVIRKYTGLDLKSAKQLTDSAKNEETKIPCYFSEKKAYDFFKELGAVCSFASCGRD